MNQLLLVCIHCIRVINSSSTESDQCVYHIYSHYQVSHSREVVERQVEILELHATMDTYLAQHTHIVIFPTKSLTEQLIYVVASNLPWSEQCSVMYTVWFQNVLFPVHAIHDYYTQSYLVHLK